MNVSTKIIEKLCAEVDKFQKLAGVFDVPNNLISLISKWVDEQYFGRLSWVISEKLHKETDLAKKRSLQVLSNSIKAKTSATARPIDSISTKFSLTNIVNWKYLTDSEKINAVDKLKKSGWNDKIRVSLIFNPRKSQTYDGQYTGNRNIKIVANIWNITDIYEANAEIDTINNTIRHEILHLAQEALADIKGVRFAGYPSLNTKPIDNNGNKIDKVDDTLLQLAKQLAENAGKNWKELSYNETMKWLEYANDQTEYDDYITSSIEFYPWLRDEIANCNRQKFNSIEEQTQWVKDFIDSTTFFTALKRKNPENWRKAVKELYKNIKWFKTKDETKKKT